MTRASKAGMAKSAGCHSNPGNGAQPIRMDLDSSTKTTRLMSWSEPRTTADWSGGVMPTKAEA